MTAWLVDTFVYSGLLIAAVLLLRRPVSRWFGPQIAYALWALPFLRFVMPPIVLPASMAPVASIPAVGAVQAPMLVPWDPAITDAPLPGAAAGSVGIDLLEPLLPLWLGGAVLLLVWRLREYHRMRRDMLADARPVGDAGRIRLVETPAVASPLAFGVWDKVVALPPLFMAHPDRTARDMAIAHELAHHRGHDLVANIAAQPLLALHWFNPLAWWGWRAMRRDQEAACDARVVAGRDRHERIAYARVIAGFAAGPSLALAAPMACPVLGEKSIIHRLRSLGRAEISAGRRRLGVAALCTTALALPLTASISYAQAEVPDPPPSPQAPLPPAPLSPPAPAAPLPPLAPPAPASVVVPVEAGAHGPGARQFVDLRRAEPGEPFSSAELERRLDAGEDIRRQAELARDEADRLRADADRVREQADRLRGEADRVRAGAERRRTEIAHLVAAGKCAGDDARMIGHELETGRAVILCRTKAMAESVRALRDARAVIAAERALEGELRRELLEELREEMEELDEELRELSFAPVPVPAPAPRKRVAQGRAQAGEPSVRATIRVSASAPHATRVQMRPAVVAHPVPEKDDCEEERVPGLRV